MATTGCFHADMGVRARLNDIVFALTGSSNVLPTAGDEIVGRSYGFMVIFFIVCLLTL